MSESRPGRKSKVLYFVLAALVVLGWASWSLDFRLAQGQSSHTQQTAKVDRPAPPSLPGKIYLRVEGGGIAEEQLGRALRKHLAGLGGFEVVFLEGAPGPEQHPLVVASIHDLAGFWTPFHGRKSAVVELKYASGTSQIGPAWSASPEPRLLESGSLWLQARSEVEVRATGIVSRPSLYRDLVDLPVRGFADKLKAVLAGPATSK